MTSYRHVHFRCALGALAAGAIVLGAGTVAAPAFAAPVPTPDIWEAPDAVDREPVGGVPDGAWSSGESGDGVETFARSVQAVADDDVAAPGLGIQSFYGFTEFALTPDVTAAVNLGNGNLVVRSADVGLNGPGIGLALDRFYNGLSDRVGGYGDGWSVSAGQDVGLEIETEKVTFRAPSGFRAEFTKDDAGAWQPPAGLNADLAEEDNGEWTVTYRGSDERLTFTDGGYLLRDADRNGNALEYRYNDDNTVASVTDAAGRVTHFNYDDGKISQILDPAGRDHTFTYEEGLLSTSTDGADVTTRYEYDGEQRLSSIETGAGAFTTFTYDDQDRVSGVAQFLERGSASGESAETSFTYADGETTVADPRDHEAVYEIDEEGRVLSTVDPLDRKREQTWTANSAVATATDALGGSTGLAGNVTEYSYDEANNPTAVTLPTGAAARATYTTGGQCGSTDEGHPYQAKCSEDAAGNQTSFDYDSAGNLLSQRDASSEAGGRELSYTYQGTDGEDCSGKTGQQCSATNGEGAVTTYEYDADGNQTKISPPAPLGSTSYTYDSVGRVLTSTDGAGQEIDYKYDAKDRLTQQTFADGSQVLYFYNADGLQTRVLDTAPGASITEYSYDARGNQTSKTMVIGTSESEISMTYDIAGNMTSYTDSNGTVEYSFDAANQLTSITEPDGSCADAPLADDAGCILFTYDDNGAETRRDLPGGASIDIERDDSGRATRITAVDADGAAASDYSYDYADPNDADEDADRASIQARTDHIGIGAPAGSKLAYSYDTLNRLTEARETNSDGSLNTAWAWSFDNNGNRLSQHIEDGDGGSWDTTYSYNEADQLTAINDDTTELEYDANGNQTRSTDGRHYSYNERDQHTGGIGAGGSFFHSYTGPTNAERTSYGDETGSTRSFTHSALGVASDTTTYPRTGHDDVTRAVTRSPEGTPVAIRYNDGSAQYLAVDVLGSPTAFFGGDGAKIKTVGYEPYGKERGSSANTLIGFAGGEIDYSSQLVKFGARYYEPDLGRFTQMDPSGQERNPYAYAGSNPAVFVDPTGTVTLAQGLQIGALAVSAAGLIATGAGAGLGVGLALGAASTALDVGSNVAAGNTGGAVAAGVFGVATAGFGAAGSLLEVPRGVALGVEAGYTGLGIGTGFLAS